MTTQLYNITTAQPTGPQRNGRYEIDGKMQAQADGAIAGTDLVELVVEPPPEQSTLAANERIVGLRESEAIADLAALTLRYWRVEQYTPEPSQPWRVSKDTLITRILAANALPQVMAALGTQSAEQQFVFEHSAWFWSTNETLRGMCVALGLNADELLAPDQYL